MEFNEEKFGELDIYNETFDPVVDKDVDQTLLSDDLSDIYSDLKGALVNYDQGKLNDAIWEWRFNIRGHCGDHLVDALRVMHRLINHYYL